MAQSPFSQSPFLGFPQAKKPPTYTNKNVVESVRDVGTDVGKTIANDLVSKSAADAFAALFGGPQAPRPQTEQRPNVARFFPGKEQAVNQAPQMRPEFSRIPQLRAEEANIKKQIDGVRMELKALAASIKDLNTEIQKTIESVPEHAGIYHLNFLERLKSVIRVLREQISESSTWLSMWSSRKKQKGYWGKYKKHGTSFGLSSERTVSTQAG